MPLPSFPPQLLALLCCAAGIHSAHAADHSTAPATAATATTTPGNGPAAQSPTSPRDIRFLVQHLPGPAWQSGKSVFEQPGIAAHIQHYRQWQQQGKLELGGPFLDHSGGMMVPVAGLSEAEVRAFADADPAVQSGLLQVQIKPWMIGMKK